MINLVHDTWLKSDLFLCGVSCLTQYLIALESNTFPPSTSFASALFNRAFLSRSRLISVIIWVKDIANSSAG